MSHAVATRLVALRQWLTSLASNAWTRYVVEPSAARRRAGLHHRAGCIS